jgi:transglutaminase-like putative cysteine protease
VLKYSLKVSNESEYIERLGDLYDPGSPFCIYEVGQDVPKDKFLIVVSKEPIDLPNVLFYIKNIDDLIRDVNVVDTGFPEEDSVLTQGKDSVEVQPVKSVVREVKSPVNTERQTPKVTAPVNTERVTAPVSSKDVERIRSLGVVLYRMLSKDTSLDVNVERLRVPEDLQNVARKMLLGEYKSMEEVVDALENLKRSNVSYNKVNTREIDRE